MKGRTELKVGSAAEREGSVRYEIVERRLERPAGLVYYLGWVE